MVGEKGYAHARGDFRKLPNPAVSVPEFPDLPIGIGKREEIGKTAKGVITIDALCPGGG